MARTSTLQRGESRAAWWFIAPWIVGFLVFTAGPMIVSLVLSFTDYSLVGETQAVGGQNYQQLLEDPRVVKSLTNTFIYALIFVPTGTVVSPRASPCCWPGSGGPPGSSARPSTCPR